MLNLNFFKKDEIELRFSGNLAMTSRQTMRFDDNEPWIVKIDRDSLIRYEGKEIYITEPDSPITLHYVPSLDLVDPDWIHMIPTVA